MDENSKRITRRILAVHLLLLLGVLAIVFFVGSKVYYSARELEKEQAVGPQEHLAGQASRGIEDYYATIINDLELAGRDENDVPTTMPGRPGVANVRERAFYPYLWHQLEGRVSALFVYDRQSRDAESGLRFIEPRNGAGAAGVSPELLDETKVLANSAHDWLTQTPLPAISRLLQVKAGSLLHGETPAGGVNLVCVPPFQGGRFIMVAVVPAGAIQARFLHDTNERKNITTTLMDDNLAVIASSSPAMFGTNLKDIDDPGIREVMKGFTANPQRQTRLFDQPMSIAGTVLEPRLITVEPVIIAGRRWPLLVTSPMSDVDAVVRELFRTALFWAAFVVISVTAILISTARWMIKGRLRLERMQHEVLSREVSQARQIQLNWLPSRKSMRAALDIAAMNHPANHISGDFYNWFDLPDGRHVITIGDVTGHGMAAAFLMATTQMLVRTCMPRVADPGACLEEVNRHLCTQAFRGQFVTMLIMVLDMDRGMMDIATAGHHPPLVSEGGVFKSLPLKSQLVLAVDEAQRYPTERFELKSRSRLLLFTDGVVDAQNKTDVRFDPSGLQKSLAGTFDTAQGMIDSVVKAVTDFRGTRELEDDLTLVAIQLQELVPRVGDVPAGEAAAAAMVK